MYSRPVSSTNPTLALFLIDQSGSMGGHWGQSGVQKCTMASNALNQTLYDLTLTACMRADEIADRVHVGIIGYGNPGVNQILGGAEEGWLPATEWCTSYDSISKVPVSYDGSRVIEREVPIWVSPASNNGTPMPQALDLAAEIVARHTEMYPESHPPIVINITDGEAEQLNGPASRVRACSTEDGDALLLNIQISSDGGHPVAFPSALPPVSSSATQGLFEISSTLPEAMASRARNMGVQIPEGARGIALNADPMSLAQFLLVGTTLAISPTADQIAEIHA